MTIADLNFSDLPNRTDPSRLRRRRDPVGATKACTPDTHLRYGLMQRILS